MKQQKKKQFREQAQLQSFEKQLSPYWNNEASKHQRKLLIEKESYADNTFSSLKQLDRMKASLDNPYQLNNTFLPSNSHQRYFRNKNETLLTSSITHKKWLSDKLDKHALNNNDEERTYSKPNLYSTQTIEPVKYDLSQSNVNDNDKILKRFRKKERLQKNASEEILPVSIRQKKATTERLDYRNAKFVKSEKQIDLVEKYLRSNTYDETTNTLQSSIDKINNFSWEKEQASYLPNSNFFSNNQETNKAEIDAKMLKSFPKSTGNLLKAKATFDASLRETYNLVDSFKQINQKQIPQNHLKPSFPFNACDILLLEQKKKINNYKNQFSNNNIRRTNYVQNYNQQFQDAKLKDFKILKKLGEGRFGVVQSAIHKRTGAIFALKCISRKQILKNGLVSQLSLQLRIQSCLKSPYIVQLYGWFEDINLYLILQYMEGGTLYNVMKQTGKLSCADAAPKIRQIAQAVHTMQEKGIVHRDIKPENVVLSYGICKLCDFGWATYCNEERRKTYCGTTDYVAPEIIMGLEYDVTVDLWCLGILIFEIIVGKAPFYHINTKETMRKIINVDQKSVPYPTWLDPSCKNIIKRLLKKNPEERITVKQLLKHSWIDIEDNQ